MAGERPTKQVIVIRKDLAMRKGKMVAQGAHASMAWLTRRLHDGPGVNDLYIREHEWAWLENSFAKICVSVNSENELLTIVAAASDAGITTHVVTDAGRTEFHGVPTITCAAIGPDYVDKIDKITGESGPLGRLPLL